MLFILTAIGLSIWHSKSKDDKTKKNLMYALVAFWIAGVLGAMADLTMWVRANENRRYDDY